MQHRWALALGLVLCIACAHAARPTNEAQAVPRRPSHEKYTAEAQADLVTDLPGWEDDSFNIFSGYITVSEAAGRALFYVFVESARDPSSDPVVLWLNGGPGCSSLGGGLMSELGPFFPHKDGKSLQKNKHSWNKLANVLFIESPAFVGFSYSNTTSDAIVGDKRTAADARAFLLGFFKRFPQYAQSDFYISGESYAGHYVPNLALEVVRGNEKAADPAINLKGFLVGNAWTDPDIDNLGAVDFWWSHALISDESADGIKATCNFSTVGPLRAGQQGELQQGSSKGKKYCDEYVDQAMQEMGAINIYDIYVDVCLAARATKAGAALAAALGDHPASASARLALRSSSKGSSSDSSSSSSSSSRQLQGSKYDPCIDNEVEVYLNLPEVQAALHANQSIVLPWRWTDCSDGRIAYSRGDLLASMLPVYRQLLKAGLRMLVYSGDVDAIVPVVGSRRWIRSLHLPVTSPWRPWYSGGQVGGYVQDYQGISFATVRGAGHMVPYTQPQRAYDLLQAFLQGGDPAPSQLAA